MPTRLLTSIALVLAGCAGRPLAPETPRATRGGRFEPPGIAGGGCTGFTVDRRPSDPSVPLPEVAWSLGLVGDGVVATWTMRNPTDEPIVVLGNVRGEVSPKISTFEDHTAVTLFSRPATLIPPGGTVEGSMRVGSRKSSLPIGIWIRVERGGRTRDLETELRPVP